MRGRDLVLGVVLLNGSGSWHVSIADVFGWGVEQQ